MKEHTAFAPFFWNNITFEFSDCAYSEDCSKNQLTPRMFFSKWSCSIWGWYS